MNSDAFNKHLQYMQEATVGTLTNKAKEYASDGDRLHNFKVAAEVQGISHAAALAGMMAKHTVSVYDMIREGGYHPEAMFPMGLWEEKIKDSINYLFLLWALLNEELIDTEMTTVTSADVLPNWFRTSQTAKREGE